MKFTDLLFNGAAWSKRTFEVSSRTGVVSGDLLTIFPPLISILNNLQIHAKEKLPCYFMPNIYGRREREREREILLKTYEAGIGCFSPDISLGNLCLDGFFSSFLAWQFLIS
jgi:hypothetical protein